MNGALIQAGLAVFGLTAVALSQLGNDRARRWAPFVGLAGQPFWFLATWGQWGVVAVVAAYTIVWAAGCWRSVWLRPGAAQ